MKNISLPLTCSLRRAFGLALALACLLGAGAQSLAQTVTRGPYLQQGTPSSVIVRWRTDVATNSRVCYGTAVGSLNTCVNKSALTTEHEVQITGLSANTRYYYSIGTSSTVLAGNNSSHFVVTHPPAGTAKPTRVWVLGDSGTANANAAAVRDAYYNFTGTRHTDLWLMLGDNAYPDGTDPQFQAAVFDMYPAMLRKSVLWPTRGNHERTDASGSVYYQNFTMPTQGQAGGVPSGTEKYYSFDYANIHFICLDSEGTSRSPTGAMATWLQEDLAANTRAWTVAFWHHPPYSKGSHNSDTETKLVEMRQNFLPILEAAGVDLVLCGHSHAYERSFLLDGHYGLSGTLQTQHKKDPGDGREDGAGAYRKPTVGPAPNEGAVYVVAGSSGKISGGNLNHPAMYISLNLLGSLVMDFDGNRVDVKFIQSTGAIQDYFTLIKGQTSTPPGAPSGLSATAVSSSQINLNWTDNSNNETQFRIERKTGAGAYSFLANKGANSTTHNDTGLSANTTYTYRVRAENSQGNSAWSNETSATTSGGLVSNLTVASGKAYVVVPSLQNGELVYIDRTFTYTNVGSYAGKPFIRTANDDKNRTETSFLSFNVSQAATVYVAYDVRATSLPNWLSSWTNTGDIIGTTDVNRRIYSKQFSAGTVTLGGNAASGMAGAGSMYSVIIGSGGAFQESGGEVVMEGEHFHALDGRTDPNGVNWQIESSVTGAVGGQYLETPGPQGTNGEWANACEASYQVNFTTTGTYNVWVRRYAVDGAQNSVFAGLNGAATTGVDNTTDYNAWVWKKLANLSVSSAGVHTFQLRRREAGYKVDRIILRTSSSTPSGNGPAESPQ